MKPENVIAFDLESGPQPLEEIKHLMPEFHAPKNYKDQEKIESYKADKSSQWHDRAALSGATGKLLAWGVIDHFGRTQMYWLDSDTSESDMLEIFWKYYSDSIHQGFSFTGSNIAGFDVPFICMRSRALGIEIPSNLLWSKYAEGAGFYDLQDWWNIFPRQNRERVSLNTMARFFGHDGKNGEGADFHKIFATSVDAAIEYLVNDLEMTRLCADRLCPKSEPRPTESPALI